MDLWKKGKDRVYDFAFVYEIKNRELLSSIRAERQEAAGTAGQQL